MSETVDRLSLRAAEAEDLPAVLAMVRALAREEQPAFPFSPGRARMQFDACLAGGAVILSTVDGVAVASCGLLPEAAPFSLGEWLRLRWCFVRAEHRRAPHMRELLAAATAMARAAGLPLCAECGGGEKLQGKLGLFRRELGDSSGACFLVRN